MKMVDWKEVVGGVALAGTAGAPHISDMVGKFAGILALVYLVLVFWNPLKK